MPAISHSWRKLIFRLAALLATVVALAVCLRVLQPETAAPVPQAGTEVTSALELLEREQYAAALQAAGAALEDDPHSVTALLVAGKAAAALGRPDEALRHWDRIPTGSGTDRAEGLTLAGQILLRQQHRAGPAELRFRRALECHPTHVPALRELARLLAVEGRTWEAKPFILALLDEDVVDVHQLALLTMKMGSLDDPELLRECHLADRSDPGILIGLAASPSLRLEPDAARLLLEEAVRLAPQMLDGQARLGLLLAEQKDWPAWLKWHQKLPAAADQHPEVWASRGSYAQLLGEDRVAMRCYWETLQRDPNHRVALYQLSMLLLAEKRMADAEPLQQRVLQLQELKQREDALLLAEQTSLEPIRAVCQQMRALGRLWEADGWYQVALQFQPGTEWALQGRREVAAELAVAAADGERLTQTVVQAQPARHLDLSHLPRPDWDSAPSEIQPPAAEPVVSRIAFQEQAEEVGLAFRYYCHPRSAAEGKRMYEFPGGGAAVLDYDLDGWPDVCLTQGCRWPPDPDQREYLDRLFRNTDGTRFVDVTVLARLHENRFSHGITFGDIDDDGFPDVYVANAGVNRLLRNNGDGTFQDVTEALPEAPARWTTSCMIADLNGDGLPDIYDVNYLESDNVFRRLCKHPDGKPRMCMPFHFPAAQDQLWLNEGNGQFRDVTRTAGVELPDGKGLGIVALDTEPRGMLDVFIANDTTPNFFLENRTAVAGEIPRFEETGLMRGVALNGLGRAEGCMGVAVGDVNQDGLSDLFVGNFYRETNTLYVQHPGGVFTDQTRRYNLALPSEDLLAFGTQFLDADADGDLDLMVANGHVDDVRAYGRPYQMRTQFFEQLAPGEPLVERFAESLGAFFEQQRLGRALVRCDWNRDGRLDVVISDLQANVALLTNGSQAHHQSLVVHLRGSRTGRDALGARVEAIIGASTFVQTLNGGDGYQGANQRLLHFGLGDHPRVEMLRVHWPSGGVSEYADVPAGSEIVCLENGSRLYRVR